MTPGWLKVNDAPWEPRVLPRLLLTRSYGAGDCTRVVCTRENEVVSEIETVDAMGLAVWHPKGANDLYYGMNLDFDDWATARFDVRGCRYIVLYAENTAVAVPVRKDSVASRDVARLYRRLEDIPHPWDETQCMYGPPGAWVLTEKGSNIQRVLDIVYRCIGGDPTIRVECVR